MSIKMVTNKEKFKIDISGKDIIKFLAIGGVLLTAIIAPNAVQAFRFLLKDDDYAPWREYNRHRVSQYVGRLQKQGLIKRRVKDGQRCYVLTAKGKRFALKYNIDKLQLPKERKWDGVWRLVIFDIPEKKKIARDALRAKFQKLGMYQLQKSVFIYPFPCRKEIDFVSDFFGVSEDIFYIESNVLDIEKRLRNIFNL